MKQLVAVLFFCLPALAFAGPLEHVAVAALKDLRQLPSADQWEYSGFIVYRDDAYLYTMFPHTDKLHAGVMFDIRAHMLPNDKLAGIYHNHPCYSLTYFTSYFSIPDIISAKFYGVPAFMLDNCTGEVHEFDWSVDTVRGTGDDKTVFFEDGTTKILHLPKGRIIGNIGIKSDTMEIAVLVVPDPKP